MVTEAFIITHEKEKAYLNIDRTYKYGGIMLLSEMLTEAGIYVDGCTYYSEFSLEKWLEVLGLNDTVVTIEVQKECDGDINSSIYEDKINDILTITIKNKKVYEVKNANNEIIYKRNDDEYHYVSDENNMHFEIGWFGKVFNYYNNVINNDIEEYCYDDWANYIWGIYYN